MDSLSILYVKRTSSHEEEFFCLHIQVAQLLIIASVSMTVFLRTQMGIDLVHANNYLGALFYSMIVVLIDGMPELSMTVSRLAVFYKQRDLHFYPAWAYAIPATILKIPLSLLSGLAWTSLTYYVIGYSPEPGRFFRHMMMISAVHMASISMFRFLASVFRSTVASTTAGSLAIVFVMLFSGFLIPRRR
ncbi:pleiotropic drug resistance protein 3 [Dorcoceras hygrometricum]|uniref:Pleiotropic drug resistance protein 3 n=1 Tax=Dorcoceras hygrometricum TaxID=472368 RepID=A0A2Z6ZY58_9LAMI|nr:pleiotropic drug resistance protein 3 [Dorcoceras hygrometricum]